MSKYAIKETGHTNAAADVWANTNDRACSCQYTALSTWGQQGVNREKWSMFLHSVNWIHLWIESV